MADISKRVPGDDCEDGERGERGKRGHRGHRGHRGPQGPAGPGGPATSLVGPTEGPAAQEAAEDIPAGYVVAVTGSMSRASALEDEDIDMQGLSCPCPPSMPVCVDICFDTFAGHFCWTICRASSNALGITSAPVSKGQMVRYVTAGPLTLAAQTWDVSTGESGGLVPGQTYYLSQTAPGRLTKQYPFNGTAIKIGVALTSTTLDVQIASGQTDGYTLVKRAPDPGPFSVAAYGFAGGKDLTGRSNASWQLAPSGFLPGTPIFKNLVGGNNITGQQPASASAWLSSHVSGLTTPTSPTAPTPPASPQLKSFISGGLFTLTEAQWNAVWTASDPNRGVGSGLLPGYPYYLSDVPGTFFLINKTGAPPVAPGNWLTKCFVALSTTTVLIQISDPTRVAAPEPAELPVLFPVFDGVDFVAVPGFVNQLDCDGPSRTVSLPAAASVVNGTLVGIKKSNRGDLGVVNLSTVLVSDTIDGAPGQGGFFNAFLANVGSSVLLVSDGISNWTVLAGGNDGGF